MAKTVGGLIHVGGRWVDAEAYFRSFVDDVAGDRFVFFPLGTDVVVPLPDHGPAQGRVVAEIHDGRYIAVEDLEEDSDG